MAMNGQEQAKLARSIELATRDRLLGTVNWRGERNGRQWFTVASRSHSGVIDRVYVGTPECGWAMEPSDGRGSHHVVRVDSASGQYHCSCPARGGVCGHIGAVAQYVARYLRDTTAAA